MQHKLSSNATGITLTNRNELHTDVPVLTWTQQQHLLSGDMFWVFSWCWEWGVLQIYENLQSFYCLDMNLDIINTLKMMQWNVMHLHINSTQLFYICTVKSQ